MPNDARWATKPYNGYGINVLLKEDEELTQIGPDKADQSSRVGRQNGIFKLLQRETKIFWN